MFRRKGHRGDGGDGAGEDAAPPPIEQLRTALGPWLASVARPAWRPQTAPGEPSRTASKFCGAPWLGPHEVPPRCAHCDRELQLFVQLDLDHLPVALGTGVLQLYYCVGQVGPEPDGHPECWAEDGWAPFSTTSSLARIVPADGLQATATSAHRMKAFPPVSIVGWEQQQDLPDPEDHDAAGLHASYDWEAGQVTIRCPAADVEVTGAIDDLEVSELSRASDGDKLGGWPSWVQGNEQPSCPTCGATMRLVFQVDSEDHVPFMFGDAGIGHLTQCPEHLDVVAFGWACG